ncbi:polyribonucleotide nucleotidyltransferase [Candidatus Parcubacteria bacterium]|jgi:polyribonucleotide nucleotidyltransferase|nr:polyribonucleotide nucleotidyltransferase [Candidatus Parcubacteria bacterium]
MSVKQFSTEVAGKELKVEIGRLAKQAHGACTVSYGETVVLATATTASQPREGIDYFPLMVDYEEKLYAAGKIKGSRFIKREGRATDEAMLTARMIDRSIRPLFKESERNDVQVVVTVLSYDGINDPTFPAMMATSISLGISKIPWRGPLAGVNLGRVDNEWVLNPSVEAKQKSDLDLFVAGSADQVIMIEAGAQEVKENDMYEAIEFAGKHIKKIMPFVEDIVKKEGQEKIVTEVDKDKEEVRSKVITKVNEVLAKNDVVSCFNPDKSKMKQAINDLTDKVNEVLKEDSEVSKDMRSMGVSMIDDALVKAFKGLVLDKKKRPDNRKLDEIRNLEADVSLLPRTHGSGLFSRGETQVLSVVTLGSPGDEQTLDTMEEDGTKKYMHHYNFPGYCVGEVKPLRGPSRRDIGHGALAEKALIAVLPKNEDFPYTVRVVSEVMGSNGSSSQASICGSTLSLMDAGVPIKAPVAGIAMGLVVDDDNASNYEILTDIQGIEDHAGHMDFKIAGTRDGITAIQLDIKLDGISYDVVKETLDKAKDARVKILDVMKKTIAEPRSEMSPYAPRITSMNIDPDKIRDVIGPGGKIINEIIAACNVNIDIEQDGVVMITSTDGEGSAKAKKWIENIVKDIEVGEIYEGKVLNIIKGRDNGSELGAIVELIPGKDGMVHISQIAHKRIEKVSDVLNVGDMVKVKVMEVDKERNRVSLSMKELLPKPAFSDKGREDKGRPAPGKPRFFKKDSK